MTCHLPTAALRPLLLALGVTACAPAGEAPGEAMTPASLAGSEWRPVVIGDLAVPDDVEVFIGFRGDLSVSGSGGCNSFQGLYEETADGGLAVGPLASTRMACPEPQMAIEDAFFVALSETVTATREGHELFLLDAGGSQLAVLLQTDWD